MDYIIDGIHITDMPTATNKQLLISHNIQVVINVTQYKNPNPNMYKSLGIEYHWFNIYDEPNNNISRYFDQAVEILTQAKADGKQSIVHCQQGQSRSVAIVMAYLIKRYKFNNIDGVLNCIRVARPQASPNSGFLEQLTAYATTCKLHNQTT